MKTLKFILCLLTMPLGIIIGASGAMPGVHYYLTGMPFEIDPSSYWLFALSTFIGCLGFSAILMYFGMTTANRIAHSQDETKGENKL